MKDRNTEIREAIDAGNRAMDALDEQIERAAWHVLHDFVDNDARAEVYWATVENAIDEVREEDAR